MFAIYTKMFVGVFRCLNSRKNVRRTIALYVSDETNIYCLGGWFINKIIYLNK